MGEMNPELLNEGQIVLISKHQESEGTGPIQPPTNNLHQLIKESSLNI